MVGCCSFGVNGLAQWCCCCCPGGKKRARLKSLEKTSETAHFAFRKGRTFSEKTTEVEHSDGSVTVCRERVFKSRACLEDVDGAALVSQLQHIIDTLYWGKAASLEDCFDPKVADDGIVCVKIFHDILAPDAKFYYWSAHFGGNVTGYLLASTAGPLRRLRRTARKSTARDARRGAAQALERGLRDGRADVGARPRERRRRLDLEGRPGRGTARLPGPRQAPAGDGGREQSRGVRRASLHHN